MSLSKEQFVRSLDATLTFPTATREETLELIEAARKNDYYSILVPRCFNRLAAEGLKGSRTIAGSGCSATLGHDPSEIKAYHAAFAVSEGIREIDMTMNLCYLKSKMYREAVMDIRKVKEAVGQEIPLKCIIEAPILTDEEIRTACEIVIEGGADFVKSASGLRGETTLHHMEVISGAVKDRIRIKAAGGIRSLSGAASMLELGAARLGISHPTVKKILQEIEEKG